METVQGRDLARRRRRKRGGRGGGRGNRRIPAPPLLQHAQLMSSAANAPRGGPRKQKERRGENNFPRGRHKGGLEVHPDLPRDPSACAPLAGAGPSSLTYTTFSFALLLSYLVLPDPDCHSPRLSQYLRLEASWPCHDAPAATLILDEESSSTVQGQESSLLHLSVAVQQNFSHISLPPYW